MAQGIGIRDARPADAPRLVEFNARMAWETEHLRLDPARLAAGVAGVFEQPQRGFYRVAEIGADLVGGLMVTREWSDWRCGDWWWIQSVYVVPEARGAGVFSALYADIQRLAREAGAVGLRLYVERDNRRAQRTYARLGMQQTEYLLYAAGFAPTPAADGR
jgi:GNAT superfamily N-acetyltransferase